MRLHSITLSSSSQHQHLHLFTSFIWQGLSISMGRQTHWKTKNTGGNAWKPLDKKETQSWITPHSCESENAQTQTYPERTTTPQCRKLGLILCDWHIVCQPSDVPRQPVPLIITCLLNCEFASDLSLSLSVLTKPFLVSYSAFLMCDYLNISVQTPTSFSHCKLKVRGQIDGRCWCGVMGRSPCINLFYGV